MLRGGVKLGQLLDGKVGHRQPAEKAVVEKATFEREVNQRVEHVPDEQETK